MCQVMRLAAPLASTDVAGPIPINSNSYYPSNGQRLMAYGFGVTENEVVSPDLKEAHVTYINNDECWSRGIQFNNVLRGEEVMCTDPFGGSTATCLGDSGGVSPGIVSLFSTRILCPSRPVLSSVV